MKSLESASFWWNVTAIGLSILAAFAVAVAFHYSWRVGAAKDESFERYKADAAKTIAVAHTEAATANRVAAEAQQRTAEAMVAASAANERSGRLELEAAEQRRRAAEATLRLEELRRRQAPRALNVPFGTFARLMRNTSVHPEDDLSRLNAHVYFWPPDDPETYTFARELYMNLDDASFSITEPSPLPPQIPIDELRFERDQALSGLFVVGPSSDLNATDAACILAAQALVEALRECGYHAEFVQVEWLSRELAVLVFPKPLK